MQRFFIKNTLLKIPCSVTMLNIRIIFLVDFWGVFTITIRPFTFVGYDMIIAKLARIVVYLSSQFEPAGLNRGAVVK